MKPMLFGKNFPGLRISIREVPRHPCPHSNLAKHINVGYRLVQFQITDDNPYINSSFQWLKLVTVKPGWNIKLREQCENTIVVEREDVILDIGYKLGRHEGVAVDFVFFTTKNLWDGTINHHKAFIQHTVGSKYSTPSK